MHATPTTPILIEQKLGAFEQLQPEFEECFRYVQDVHGQKRFPTISVADSVHYLHALWICECKDRLLSIYKNIERYEGRYCLELLRLWQEGDNTDVVAFLHRKLDMLPFADITRQYHEAVQRAQSRHEPDACTGCHFRTPRGSTCEGGANCMRALRAPTAANRATTGRDGKPSLFLCTPPGIGKAQHGRDE